MKRIEYASDISREKFAEIVLRTDWFNETEQSS